MTTSSPRRGKEFLPKAPAAEPDLRGAIDTIPQLVWSAFPDGTVEFRNQRWLEYTGLTAEQVHPEDMDELLLIDCHRSTCGSILGCRAVAVAIE
jgi:PAS domain-containing protein